MASVDEKLAVSNVPVWVEWTCDNVKRLDDSDHATLDWGLYRASGEAFFKIKVPIGLKGRAKKTNFYFFVRPEQFGGLEMDDGPSAVAPSITASFVRNSECSEPGDVVALRWSFKQAGVLVGPPPTPPLLPKSKKSGDMLESLKSLARATALTLYLPKGEVEQALFDATSTLISKGNLKSSQDEYVFERLYSGKGGHPVDVGRDELHDDNPPSYDELGPSPPPPSRRRKGSTPTSPSPSKRTKPDHVRDSSSERLAQDISQSIEPSVEAWKRMLEAQLQALCGEVNAVREKVNGEQQPQIPSADTSDTRSRLDRIEEQMRELRDQMNALQETMRETSEENEQRLEKRLEQRLEVRLERRLQQRFEDAWKEASEALEERFEQRIEERLDDRMDPAIDDAIEEADMRIEERALQIKDEMLSFVQEELQQVKEELRDGFDIGSAVLRVEFER